MSLDSTRDDDPRKSTGEPADPVTFEAVGSSVRGGLPLARNPGLKPRPDFPLYQHRTGRWAKKVLGETVYFRRVADDPNGVDSETDWLRDKDELRAGRKRRDIDPDALTIRDLVNRFLTHKERLRDNGEINPRTFQGYYATCETLVRIFKKGRAVSNLESSDFGKLRDKLAKSRGAVALRNEMQRSALCL